jgi:hypothetical protein
VFTGEIEAVFGYATVLVSVQSDVDSATDGLSIQFSPNAGTTWYETDVYTIIGDGVKTFTFQPVLGGFRLVYTNGVAAQSEFLISTVFHPVVTKSSSHRLDDDLSTQDDAELVKAVLAAKFPNGLVGNIDATAGGNLKVSVEEFDATAGQVPPDVAVSLGYIPNMTTVNKYGRTTNADSGVQTDIWDRANATHNQATWVAPTAARIHAIVSSNAETGGATAVKIYGLTSWTTDEVSETVALTGTTPVNTVNSYVIIHRMVVTACGANGPNIGYITATAAVDGTITAQIEPLVGQTRMVIYGIPSTKTLCVQSFYLSIQRAQATAASNITMLQTVDVTVNPNVWLQNRTIGLNTTGTSSYQRPVFPALAVPGPVILKIAVDTNANDCDVSAGFGATLATN